VGHWAVRGPPVGGSHLSGAQYGFEFFLKFFVPREADRRGDFDFGVPEFTETAGSDRAEIGSIH
jgi:hypothetical protein